MSEYYPAISIRQPWAWAVIHGGKNIENRSMTSTSLRGPVLVHASKSGTKQEFRAAAAAIAAARAELGQLPIEVPDMSLLPRGYLVGVVNVVGAEQHPEAFGEKRTSGWRIGGCMGLLLRDAVECDPVPCGGQINVPFYVPAHVVAGTTLAEAFARLEVLHGRR
jgi:hypothetical protein